MTVKLAIGAPGEEHRLIPWREVLAAAARLPERGVEVAGLPYFQAIDLILAEVDRFRAERRAASKDEEGAPPSA